MERYDVSGIYIFDKFPDEEKRQPTCIEDCQEETRVKWLNSLDIEALHKTGDLIMDSLQKLIDLASEENEKISIIDVYNDVNPAVLEFRHSKYKDKAVYAVNDMCGFLHRLAEDLITKGVIARKES